MSVPRIVLVIALSVTTLTAAVLPVQAQPSTTGTDAVDEVVDLASSLLACEADASEPVPWAGLRVVGSGSFSCPGAVTVEVSLVWNGIGVGYGIGSGEDSAEAMAIAPICAPGVWQTIALGNGVAIGASRQVVFVDDCIPFDEAP